jgi:hypothetical protein
VLWNFEQRRINYLYVFEFSQAASASWMQVLEYGLLMLLLSILSTVLFARSTLRDEREACYSTAVGFPTATPYIMPVFMALLVGSIAFPIRHVFFRTRNSFFRVFRQCLKLPFVDVRFVDFFVADWGTSLIVPCGDLFYVVCYYTAGLNDVINDHPTKMCANARHDWNYPVVIIPYFWRGCQTLKMYFKTKKIAHLINHGKYQSCILFFVLEWANALWPSDALNICVWISRVWAQLYCWVWDVLMDWGWISGKKRIMMFPGRVYVIAAIVDFCLRMYWIFVVLYIQPAIGKDYTYLLQGTVEVFRRSMWSIFRIENENVNNLELYRAIDFVPQVALRDANS